MDANSKYFFMCTKSDCVKQYNDYLTLVKGISQYIEALHDKAKQIQRAAEQLTQAHPTDMVKKLSHGQN